MTGGRFIVAGRQSDTKLLRKGLPVLNLQPLNKMDTRNSNSVRQDESVLLFRKLPLVCHKVPLVKPIICLNIPFVNINRYAAGFTLVELIITLTIAGILAALAIPAMQTFILDQRLTSQANEFITDLNLVRSEAVKRGASVTLCSSVDLSGCSASTQWETGRIAFIDSDGDGTVDAGDTIMRVGQRLEGSNTFRPVGGSTTGITFTGAGLTSLASGEITLRLCDTRLAGKAVAVLVNFTGRARIDRTVLATACPTS